METAPKNEALGAAAAAQMETPLAATYRRAGAKMGVWFGCTLPDDFGDAAAEYRYARESVALIDKNYRAYLSLTGPDRVRYLNAILTNNIKGLSAGEGNVSLLLNPQGHILAEIETHAFADKLFCVSYAMIRERLIEWLDKYIIMDDVTPTDETERLGTLALEGPKATAVVKELTGIDLASMNELAGVDAEILRSAQDDSVGEKHDDAGGNNSGDKALSCRIVKRSPGGVAGAEFVVEREKLAELWKILLEAVRKHGGGPMGYTALSAQRLAQGVPWFGYDFGEKQIPHEAGLEQSHISYTKGCYTGQEIVERVRSRGQVNRRRVELLFSGDAVPEAGAALTLDGKEMGYVTRAAKIPGLAGDAGTRVIGMGYVRKEGNAMGTTLQWAHGGAAVAQFPGALKS
jgi:folate-binding protein YgfZ